MGKSKAINLKLPENELKEEVVRNLLDKDFKKYINMSELAAIDGFELSEEEQQVQFESLMKVVKVGLFYQGMQEEKLQLES